MKCTLWRRGTRQSSIPPRIRCARKKREIGEAPKGSRGLYRPELNRELLFTVGRKPEVISLLYDLNLLPEVLISQEKMTVRLFAAYNRLEGVLLAFKAMEMLEQERAMTVGAEDQHG